MSDWWSILRGILGMPPSEENWRTLWLHLLIAPSDEYEHITQYVNAHTASWPAAMREVRLTEVQRLVEEGLVWCLAIPRCLTLDANLSDRALQSLHEVLRGSEITHLQNIPGSLSLPFLLEVMTTRPLKSLRSLSVDRVVLGDKIIDTLARLPIVHNLQSLTLKHCQMGQAGMMQLTRSPYLSQLTELTLVHVGGARLRFPELFRAPMVHRLHTLHLEGDKMETEAISALCQSLQLKKLVSLTCCDSHLGDREARLLAQASNLRSLKELDLSANQIGPVGRDELTQSPHLQALERLCLDDNPCTHIEMESIAR